MSQRKDPLSFPASGDAVIEALPPERVGPYLRAIQAGLNAMAPNDDWVPLREALAHLTALDPAVSGTLLAPAEIDTRSGLPAFPWMERALAEQLLARQSTGQQTITDADIARARRLDEQLADRMSWRRNVHDLLQRHTLLPTSRIHAAVKRLGRTTDFDVTFDRMTPQGKWMRIRIELSGRSGWERSGPIGRTSDGKAVLRPGMLHLLSRHMLTALMALRTQLMESTGAEVVRLSRSLVGPFWFPGQRIPSHVPEALSKGLLLHLSNEVIGKDVRHSVHRDPLHATNPLERIPEGYGLYRERRFAATPNLHPPLQAWIAEQGMDVDVASLVPRG